MNTLNYIKQNILKTKRYNPTDKGTLIGLPYPYTVPCVANVSDDQIRDGVFNEMYYWDTYFTNVGLIKLGYVELAKNNCDNMLFLVDKFGYMPNGNRLHYLGGSQPPYLALMVKDVYQAIKDKNFLKNAYNGLKKEYEFWMTKRIAPNGLNHYGTDKSDEYCVGVCQYVSDRTGVEIKSDFLYNGKNYMAEAESGWDFCARFDGRCMENNAVDLNSNLYFYEKFFEFCEIELQISNGENWKNVAIKRKELMDKYLFDSSLNIYLDYNYITGEKSKIISSASFQPYFVGLADNANGVLELLSNLETEHGLLSSTQSEHTFQWGYPNGWAPLHYVAAQGLKNYGLEKDAERIAQKYVALIDKNFEKTGGLWEKYNMLTGDLNVVCEYDTPQMLGWTAGVYVGLYKAEIK